MKLAQDGFKIAVGDFVGLGQQAVCGVEFDGRLFDGDAAVAEGDGVGTEVFEQLGIAAEEAAFHDVVLDD